MLGLAGFADADARAGRVLELETRLARTHASRTDSVDVARGNNPWTRADFDLKAPGLDWSAFLGAAGLDRQPAFIVWHPGAVTGLAALVKSEPLETWKEYLAVRALEHAAPFLPRAFVDERFRFYGTALRGTPKLLERWKRADRLHRRGPGRRGGEGLRGAPLPARGPARAAGHGRAAGGRLRPAHRPARLDGPGHPGPGQGQAGHAAGGDRLPRPLEGLPGPGGGPRRRPGATCSAPSSSSTGAPWPSWRCRRIAASGSCSRRPSTP